MSDGETLTGTFYKGDIQLLLGPPGFGISIPVSGRRKEESGARLYTEWRGLTATVQFTKQLFAGLHRQGEEIELGYQIPWSFGPSVGGEALVQGIQPAVRWSALQNDFKGPKNFVDPSMWWNWVKTDYGIRIGLAKHTDLTIERAKHVIVVPAVRLRPDETLVTLRVRI